MKSTNLPGSTFLGRFPLRVVLTIPFLLQIFVVVGVIGWLSFKSGQDAVNDVSSQLRSEITARIEDRLNAYLETPHLVNRINAEAIRQQLLDLQNIPAVQNYLFNQIQQFDTVSLIALGTENGDYIEVQRYQNGALNVAVEDASTGGNLEIWATDADGNRTELTNTVENYDPRQRPWYQAAAGTGTAVWTDIYPYASDQTLAISANQPFYSGNGELAAVASTDLTLSQINDFLRSLKVGKTGQTFIMERDGALVAASTGENPTGATGDDTNRLNAANSANPLIQQTANHLVEQFGNLQNISGSRQLDFEIDGQTEFVQVTPFTDERGIDWLIAVVVPESDFMGQINANVRNTVLLSLLALIVAVGVGILTARWVVHPILSLNAAAQKMADGEWNQPLPVNRADEVGGLAQSFDRMAHQLQATFNSVQASEKKYRTLFEDSHDTIFISSPTGQIIDINPAGEQLFGYSREEFLQMNARDLYVNPEDRTHFRQQIETKGSVTDFATIYRRKDGTTIDALITATVRRAPDGTIENYQGVIRDITAQKRAEQQRLRLVALEQELTLARDIQRSLLPPNAPQWPGIDIICYTQPAREMGGDLYAYYLLPENRFAVTVGDVSGKGMPAALLMSISLASLQTIVQQRLDPEALLHRLNGTLSTYTRATGQNLALVYLEFTPPNNGQSGTLWAVNAGCIYPFVRRANGTVEMVDVFGLPLGVDTGSVFDYRAGLASLDSGDLIVLVSDGVVEAANHQRELFGFERLQQAIAGGPGVSAKDMLTHLQFQVNAFTWGNAPHDDMTIVVVKV